MPSTMGKKATCPGSGCSAEMPSYKYSFVRGRPPLMRGSTVAGGRLTPGASCVRLIKLRLLSGSAITVVPGMCVSMSLSPACSSGASALIVTVCASLPTGKTRFVETVWPTLAVTPWRFKCSKPSAVTSIEYTPGTSCGNKKSPAADDVVFWCTPVEVSVRTTSA